MRKIKPSMIVDYLGSYFQSFMKTIMKIRKKFMASYRVIIAVTNINYINARKITSSISIK